MIVLFVSLVVSLAIIGAGIKTYKEGFKISYILIGLAIAMFYGSVIYYMNSELNMDVGYIESYIFVFLVSMVSIRFITQSCDQSLKVGWWKK